MGEERWKEKKSGIVEGEEGEGESEGEGEGEGVDVVKVGGEVILSISKEVKGRWRI